MAWTNKRIAIAVAASLALILSILMLLLHHLNATSPGHSKAASDLNIMVERIANSDATPEFNFKKVPAPSQPSATASAKFSLVAGGQDVNGARVEKLRGGSLPGGPDAPRQSFFFNDGSVGGRILVDLNQPMNIQQINTYSWHTGPRAPQLYKLYASSGTDDGSAPAADRSVDLPASEWKFLASVDTRPRSGEPGGQYGVSITSPNGLIGNYRYLLFDCKRTEEEDRWGNTFYSKIDVVAK